jgi:cell division protein ZapB
MPHTSIFLVRKRVLENKKSKTMASNAEIEQLGQLEQQIDELLVLTTVLSKENRALRTQQKNWSTERAKLIEKNELAKSRVESMIMRLKALEKD